MQIKRKSGIVTSHTHREKERVRECGTTMQIKRKSGIVTSHTHREKERARECGILS